MIVTWNSWPRGFRIGLSLYALSALSLLMAVCGVWVGVFTQVAWIASAAGSVWLIGWYVAYEAAMRRAGGWDRPVIDEEEP